MWLYILSRQVFGSEDAVFALNSIDYCFIFLLLMIFDCLELSSFILWVVIQILIYISVFIICI